MKKININDILSSFNEFVLTCINTDDVIKISTPKGNVVMLSEQNYNNLIETLNLIKIHNYFKEISEGVNTPLNDCKKINW